MRRLAVPALTALAALALAACGSSHKSSSTSSRPTSSTSAATTASTSAATTASTPSSTTTAPIVGLPPCTASTLKLAFLGQQGATGHGELGFAFTNVGSKSCHTYGYPGVLFLDRVSGALPTNPIHTTHDLFGSAPLVAFTLAPGHSASFRLGVTHGISSTAGCTTAYGLQAIAPNDTATLRTTIPQGAYECRTATVSPVRPGMTAYP